MKFFGFVLVFVLLFTPVLQAEDAYDVDWVDQYGTLSVYGSGRWDHGKSVATDSVGNIYVTGDVGGSLDGEPYNGGTTDMFISKYNTAGIRLWSRLLGSSSDNYYNRDYGNSIVIDSNDNIYVGGWTSGILPGQTSDDDQNGDGFLVRYNTDGQLIWTRQFGTVGYVAVGDVDVEVQTVDQVEAVATDASGNIYVTGRSYFGTQVNDQIFIKKFDAEGLELWDRQFSSVNPSGWINDVVTSIATDSNGGVYVAGYTEDVFEGTTAIGTSFTDAFLAKYDSAGKKLWIKQFGTAQGEQALSVTVGNNGNLTTGTAENIYVTGATYGCFINIFTDCNDGYDAFLVAFSQNGTELWSKQFGENGEDVARSITTDDSGNVYVTGTTTGGWNYDTWGYGIMFYGYSDVYVVKFDNSGAFNWFTMFGGRYVDTAESITVDNSGNVYVAGSTESILASPTSYDKSPGYWDIFLAKLAGPEATNIAPLADAGADFSVPIGALASLNGGTSTDPDLNYPLTYVWSFSSVPSGSGALLSGADTVNPTFTPEIPGDYVIDLVVTDSLGASSLPDAVTVNTYNTPPVADAGQDQLLNVINSLVTLDGSGSYDDDGDDISYAWKLVQRPVGSAASLNDITLVAPTFTADVNGDYQITLTVTDTWGSVTTDDVVVSFNNVAPVADAGANQSAVAGEIVYLNGAASSDANEDLITFSWNLSTVPDGSTAVISDATIAAPFFTADLSGTYIASLVVNDGIVDSIPDSTEIVVVEVITNATEAVSETIVLINDIPVENFRNVNLSNALTNKLNAVLKMIANEQYGQALNKLTTDILPKTDGCALNGVPDKKDWIETCEEQEPVYNYILETITLLETML
ncbi:MAG: SBBP repeat-containing protein [Bacteroidota bacterium]